MPASEPRILVVEDDDAIRALLLTALRREEFNVDDANDGAAALRLTSECEYAVIVLDLMMPGMNGFDFLDAFHAMSPRPRSIVVVVTAFDERKIARLDAQQVHAIIRKPFDIAEFVAIVRELVSTWSTPTTGVPVPAPDVAPDVMEPLPNPELTN